MRSVTCLVFSFLLLLTTVLITLFFSISLGNFVEQIKLENETAIYLHGRFPTFQFSQLYDRIRVCEIKSTPKLATTPIHMTNFSRTLTFDLSQDFSTHISDFQIFQRLHFRSLTCECEQGECYDFEYLKFNVVELNQDMKMNEQIFERVFTVPLNRKQNPEQQIEAVTQLNQYSRMYINYLNEQKEPFMMKCQLEIDVEQASYDLEQNASCRIFDENQHEGTVHTPAWIKAETQLVSNVLVEISSDQPLQYKLEGQKQQFVMVAVSVALFIASLVLYCRNEDNQLDLEDNM